MAHFILNFVNADAAQRPTLREQAAEFLRARMWGVAANEPHRDALAAGDLVLVYLGAPDRELIGRAELASAVHDWTPSEAQAYAGDLPSGVSLAQVEEWDPPVPMTAVLSQIDRSENARADFETGVVRITANEFETALAVASGEKRTPGMVEDGMDSWFVENARDLRWQENELGATCEFDKHRARFAEFGINLTVLQPGQPMTMYHRERYQEGFLVLRGECLLIVESRELPLRRWDYFHCPADVAHAIVGAGDGLTVVLAVGSRVGPDVILYPRDETALKHAAGVEQETPHPKDAYARFTRPAPDIPFRGEFLTD